MRKAASVISVVILIALIVVVLRASPDGEPPVVTAAPTIGTSLAETTDTTTTGPASNVTLPDRTTDTTGALDTVPDTGLRPNFVLSEVVFGDNGYVAITNVGGAVGNLEGHALCQRPNYFVLPSIEVEPFQVVWVALGDGAGITNPSVVSIVPANGQLGRVGRDDGEMALYRSAQFSAPDELRSYVEWGSSGHGRSSVAIEAGLWDPDAFIEIPDDTFGVSSTDAQPTSPSDWVASIGG